MEKKDVSGKYVVVVEENCGCGCSALEQYVKSVDGGKVVLTLDINKAKQWGKINDVRLIQSDMLRKFSEKDEGQMPSIAQLKKKGKGVVAEILEDEIDREIKDNRENIENGKIGKYVIMISDNIDSCGCGSALVEEYYVKSLKPFSVTDDSLVDAKTYSSLDQAVVDFCKIDKMVSKDAKKKDRMFENCTANICVLAKDGDILIAGIVDDTVIDKHYDLIKG